MRKITAEAVRAFYNGENYSKSNTEVKQIDWHQAMLLHWNLIAFLFDGCDLHISSAGWKTTTTKERLNGVIPGYNLVVKQIKWEWFLCNENEKVSFEKGNKLNGIIIF